MTLKGLVPPGIKLRYWDLRRQALRVPSLAATWRHSARTLAGRVPTHTDYERWTDAGRLEQWWEARTAAMARFVPEGARVIEFGAGHRRLPFHLDPSVTYFASDIVAREPDTIVCDLNERPLPDLRYLAPDVAVFAGVLEYLADLPEVVAWLGTQVRLCVVSYEAADKSRWSLARLHELGRRRRCGYLNDYDSSGFVKVFESNGFACRRTDLWNSQELYLFERALR